MKILKDGGSGLERTRKVGVTQFVAFSDELITSRAEVLRGGCNMEKPSSSERPTIVGYRNG